jgi:hypothetical protein
MSDEKKTVIVACDIPNGITLQREEMVEGPLGIKTAQRIGEPVTLRQGANEGVDAAFWDAWLNMHEKDPLVVQGAIRAA